MTVPGVGPITAMAVIATFNDASRFRRSSSAGAYLGLTPRRYESGEISRNGRVSKRGDGFTRRCLSEPRTSYSAEVRVARGYGTGKRRLPREPDRARPRSRWPGSWR
ncbi:transposase [Oceanicola granulosus]|uniref:transposase n=1 Tax=Oceanicola granulosus TaxID=252302 RepID=UPI0003089648